MKMDMATCQLRSSTLEAVGSRSFRHWPRPKDVKKKNETQNQNVLSSLMKLNEPVLYMIHSASSFSFSNVLSCFSSTLRHHSLSSYTQRWEWREIPNLCMLFNWFIHSITFISDSFSQLLYKFIHFLLQFLIKNNCLASLWKRIK